jgi:PAS domain S-box-containing protein
MLHITERHQIEQEKQKLGSGRLFKLVHYQKLVEVAQNSPDLIGIATPEGKVLFVNEARQELVGIDNDQEGSSKAMSRYVPPNEVARLGHEVLPMTHSAKPLWGEVSIRHFLTGEIIPVEMPAFPICDTHGKVIAIANIGRNIRGRKQFEGALREAEERYRGIFEGAVVGIFQSDFSGRYLSANPAMARVLGFDSPEELLTSVTDIYKLIARIP